MSTIDPGVEDRIKESADDVEGQEEGEKRGHAQQADYAKQPSRWWFASTACPLLAGTFGPLASGFNICALVYHWRQYIPPGGNESTSEQSGQTLPDPPFLIGLNVASLVCALVGNASLLLNMAQRVRFSVAQPITIAGFLLAGILLIVDLAVLGGKANYAITRPEAIPHERHALTGAFYYAIFAASIYIIIGCLMFLTVYGAITDRYRKQFELTGPQRTLMLQTMSFVAYLLLGALVYSHIEGWEYLNAVYWADVTLLTVGLGDYSPSTPLGQGLMFPFAIGGILMIGLVVGSIRSLVLDRGKEKLSMRIVEKKRFKAIHHVDELKQTIRISPFAKADFNTDPSLSPTQRRREEFTAMRKVQAASETERRWFGLLTSAAFALLLWFVGAAIFQQTEYTQQWSYLQALYFAYTSLLTIGYGDLHPQSNSGKAFFVIWSQLAVPSLTILISNMGDTIVKSFSDFTVWIGAVTVLPGEQGFRAGFRMSVKRLVDWAQSSLPDITLPGILGDIPKGKKSTEHPGNFDTLVRDRLAERLRTHVTGVARTNDGDRLGNDIKFYHYVLARESRSVQKDLNTSPPKQYSWGEWEYFLMLIGNEDHHKGPDDIAPARLVPKAMETTENTHDLLTEDAAERKDPNNHGTHEGTDTMADDEATQSENKASSEETASEIPARPEKPNHQHTDNKRQQHPRRAQTNGFLHNWTWLSKDSPLMSGKSEAEWILDRLSAALERELDRQQHGRRRQPPIGLHDVFGHKKHSEKTVDGND